MEFGHKIKRRIERNKSVDDQNVDLATEAAKLSVEKFDATFMTISTFNINIVQVYRAISSKIEHLNLHIPYYYLQS